MLSVTKEPPNLGSPFENCVQCLRPTTYWFSKLDIPLCLECAKTASESELPTKEQWIKGDYKAKITYKIK